MCIWPTLNRLRSLEALSDLDLELARFLARQDPEAGYGVLLGACLASQAPHQGHTCVDLARQASSSICRDDPEGTLAPSMEQWQQDLHQSSLVGSPGDFCPLILEGNRLYLQRYWSYEAAIAADLRQRGAQTIPEVDRAALQASLDGLFNEAYTEGPHWQKTAAAIAVLRRLTVITGGPGTGKTTTVTRLLAALRQQPGGKDLRMALAAPTGKAAARMQEAIRQAKAALCPFLEGADSVIPEQAFTLHRLLGARSGSSRFRHHQGHPLACDVLVIDEASMVDVALFAKLLAAVPDTCRLIIVGDSKQLAPVEAGNILGPIAELAAGFTPNFRQLLAEATGTSLPETEAADAVLSDCQVELQQTHRFATASGLGRLLEAVKTGNAAQAQTILQDNYNDLTWEGLPDKGPEELVPRLLGHFKAVLAAARQGDAPKAFAAYRSCGILNALRQGPWGSTALNLACERHLRHNHGLPPSTHWYPGRIILITQNDYQLGLFNGDIGITLPLADGRLQVAFETPDHSYRYLPPTRLPAFEVAFVLTVHKSQGSEFHHVTLLLPPCETPLLARQLLYTGLSRSRESLSLIAEPRSLEQACTTQLQQTTGLTAKLSASASSFAC